MPSADQSSTADQDIRHETIFVVVTHGLLLATLIWFLAFLVPTFTAFKGLSQIPAAFEFVISSAFFLRRFFLLVVPVSLILLWLDTLAYRSIRRQRGRGAASVWFVAIVIVLLAILVFCLIAITAPLTWMRT